MVSRLHTSGAMSAMATSGGAGPCGQLKILSYSAPRITKSRLMNKFLADNVKCNMLSRNTEKNYINIAVYIALLISFNGLWSTG